MEANRINNDINKHKELKNLDDNININQILKHKAEILNLNVMLDYLKLYLNLMRENIKINEDCCDFKKEIEILIESRKNCLTEKKININLNLNASE